MEEITLQRDKVIAAYNYAKEQKDKLAVNLLEKIFDKETFNQDITERVKTFSDAINILDDDDIEVIAYCDLCAATAIKSIRAHSKLRIITKVLNEGWKPSFKRNETAWCPCFDINGNNIKFAYAHFSTGFSETSSYPNRFLFNTCTLAEYAGKQFIDIWKDYLISY